MRIGFIKGELTKYISIFVLLIVSFTLSAQDAEDLKAITKGLSNVEKSCNKISKEFDDNKIPSDSLKGTNELLIVYRDSVFAMSDDLKKDLNDANLNLTQLGPAPDEGDPAEPKNVTEKRSDLNSQISKISGLITSSNVLNDDIEKLIKTISNARSSVFLEGITDRTASPFSPDLWKHARKELKDVIKNIKDYYSGFWTSFWKDDKRNLNIFLLIISILLSIAVLLFPKSKFGEKITSAFKLESDIPSIENKLRLISKPLYKTLLIFLSTFVLVWGLSESGIIDNEGKDYAYKVIIAISVSVFIWYLAKNVFIPNQFVWGKVICAPGKDNHNRYLFVGMILIFITNEIIDIGLKNWGAEMSLVLVHAVISTSLFSVLLFMFFSFKNWVYDGGKDSKTKNPSTSKSEVKKDKIKQSKKVIGYELIIYIGSAIAIILLAEIVLEYLRLANFLFQHIVLVTLFFILFNTVKTLAQYLVTHLKFIDSFANSTSSSSNPRPNSIKTESRKESVYFWLNLVLNIVLTILAFPLFLYALGMDWLDIKSWMDFLSKGFKIGAITISFKNIFSGIVVFLSVYLSIKWAASVINKQLQEHSNMDSGLRNSIIKILNYIGIIIAIIASFPIFGFSFSNVAIVAGALSVGIGFGLQNIVLDYFSGLILLIERPVKIGDWVVVSAGEGYIKDIRGRVTTIQTWDRAIIIVPNSELINSPVQNWFYENIEGRIVVTVGVDYSTDIDRAKEILLKSAEDHPLIVTSPKPSVILASYGENSVNFELRGFIKNIDNGYTVKSQLRHSIFDKFGDAGIVIPIPQRDIHMFDGKLGRADKGVSIRVEDTKEKTNDLKPDTKKVPDTKKESAEKIVDETIKKETPPKAKVIKKPPVKKATKPKPKTTKNPIVKKPIEKKG